MNNQTSNKRFKSDITPEDNNIEGFSRSLLRDAPPSHFRFKIESFSSLSTSSLDRYESCEFDVGDYKWRLALYPNGNKNKDGKDHISLYLVLDEKFLTNLHKEISVAFTFSVYDHIRDKYLSVQGASRFHAMKTESGIDKFIPLKIFNDPSSGYLVNNTCMFGADVILLKYATKGQCLSMIAVKPIPFKYTWKVQYFSRLEDKAYYSDKFTTGGHNWKILIYPKGQGTEKGNSLSMYLSLVDDDLLPAGKQVLVEYKLRVVNQHSENHKELKATVCMSAGRVSMGWPGFLKLSEMNKSTGYMVNDTCMLQADVIVLGSAKNWA